MFWRTLTSSEARLPTNCQKPAMRARKHSALVRIYIAVLLVLCTSWIGFQIGGCIYNARGNAFAREIATCNLECFPDQII